MQAFVPNAVQNSDGSMPPLGRAAMREPPAIYADWVILLEDFAKGDDAVTALMQCGSLEWTSVVAERWVEQVGRAFSRRIDALSLAMQNAFSRAATIDDIAQAMLLARRGLAPLEAFIAIEIMPQELANHLRATLDGWAIGTQEHLEKQAEAVRHRDYGQLVKTFRDHPLKAGLTASQTSSSPPDFAQPSARRRMILP